MPLLGLAVAVAASTVLLWAAIEKARDFRSFTATLRQLGAPFAIERPLAVVVILTEATVSAALLVWPTRPATLATLIALAFVFAAAGLVALRRGDVIMCGCFGVHGRRRLGWPQLLALPLWLSVAAVLWANGPAHALPPASLAAVVTLVMATLRIPGALRAAAEARGDRRSASEMYAWLSH